MATTRLKLYQGACMLCGIRGIADLTVREEARFLLDEVWNDDGIKHCLEQGQWIFAICASRLDYDTAIAPAWGYRRAFAKPDDWVNTSAVCQDEYFRVPLLGYSDEVGFYFADLDQIYVKYVSNGANYGQNLARWPASFTEYVKAYFASKIIYRVSASAERREEMMHPRTGILEQARLTALNRDAMAKATQFPARGSWTRSRAGRGISTWADGGNRSRLIG